MASQVQLLLTDLVEWRRVVSIHCSRRHFPPVLYSALAGQLAIQLQVPYTENHSRWKNFAVFSNQLVYCETFSLKQPVQQTLPCKTTIQPRMFSSELKFSSATVNLFCLERFATYNIQLKQVDHLLSKNQPQHSQLATYIATGKYHESIAIQLCY